MRFFSTLFASVLGTLIAAGIIVLVFFMLIFGVALATDDTPTVRDGSILTMNLSGTIPEVSADDPLARAFGDQQYDLRTITRSLQKAAVDDRIEGIWLRVDGTSASWGSLSEVREALNEVRAAGKPIYASGGDHMMQEADYFVASAADSIFASPEAPFLLNGFQLSAQFFQGTLEKLGIEADVIRSGEYKSAVEQFTRRDFSPESEFQLQEILNTQNDYFMTTVSEHRGFEPEDVSRHAEEDVILTAKQAHEAGLIDALIYPDEVRSKFKQRLGINEDDDLITTSLGNYRRVSASDAGLEEGREGEVAIVYANGTIVSGRSDEGPFGEAGMIGSRTFRDAMEEARTTDRIDAVVVRTNSPGGAAAAADEMWRAINLTAEEKPVVVSMGNVAASGGYWLASGSNHIIANPVTITGSIGVFSILFDATEFFDDQLGITFDRVQTSEYADMFSGLSSLSPSERQLLEESSEETYQRFLERVAENRGMDAAEVDEVARGRVWSGQDAYDIGLVDELGGLQTAIERAAELAELEEGTYQTRVVPRPKTFLEQLATAFGDQSQALWARISSSPTERALLERQQMLDRLIDEHGTVQARMPYDISIE